MANLRQIKTKIKSVGNLKKITRALEVVSTVKLQKTKRQADSLKDYLVDLLAILSQVGEKYDVFGNATATAQSTSDKTLCIVLTSERGLCGGLNSKLLKKVWVEVGDQPGVEFFAI
ncbi:MAG: F0F1 ATP synthase subunit gamma [Candidatus Peribacteria bacterium]|nr:MAG: F0F1 ATP synthase subunit gamma [Candidatus Peribacteria bacterium]